MLYKHCANITEKNVTGVRGFEPPVYSLGGCRLIQTRPHAHGDSEAGFQYDIEGQRHIQTIFESGVAASNGSGNVFIPYEATRPLERLVESWWARPDLNRRPSGYEPDAPPV